MLNQIIIGIIGIAIGIFCVIKARDIVQWFGTSATIERRLGPGGTYTFLRILGVFLIFTFILFMFGWLQQVIVGILRAIGLV